MRKKLKTWKALGTDYPMKKLATSIESYIKAVCPDADKLISATKRNTMYMEAVRKVWKNKDASRLILDHTNAFYIRKDDRPKKGIYKDRPYMLCDICIDDPAIRSEVDVRRELLTLALKETGLTFDELRILPARRGMRDKHPFKEKD